MFLNIIKYKALKKGLSQALVTALPEVILKDVRTVGIVLDRKDFGEIHLLRRELELRGISKPNISFLVYQHGKGVVDYDVIEIGNRDFNSAGVLQRKDIQEFVDKPFDLLLNFYDMESLVLLWVSSHSKARFKVGFTSVKAHVNNLSISLTTDKFKVFIAEVFKYIELFKNKN